MMIEAEIDGAMKDANVQAYPKAAPQVAEQPFTVYRQIESEPINTLNGYGGITRTDFVFESWAQTQAAANAQRDSVVSAIRAKLLPDSSGLYTLSNQYQLPSGEAVFDDQNNSHMSPCAFSFWHS